MQNAPTENNFFKGWRNPTSVDVVLAEHYYPLLIDVASKGEMVTFKDVQAAIPVSTGRRFEFIRLYTREHGLPDLSSWVVNQSGKNSDIYQADFDPAEERRKTQAVDWSHYEGDWSAYIKSMKEFKPVVKTKPLTEKEAQQIVADYYRSVRDEIPSLVGFSLSELREKMIAGLTAGDAVEDVFKKTLFSVLRNKSGQMVKK
jgi:hypothetical protein